MAGYLFDHVICPSCSKTNHLYLELDAAATVPKIVKYMCKNCGTEQHYNRILKAYEPKRMPLPDWTTCEEA